MGKRILHYYLSTWVAPPFCVCKTVNRSHLHARTRRTCSSRGPTWSSPSRMKTSLGRSWAEPRRTRAYPVSKFVVVVPVLRNLCGNYEGRLWSFSRRGTPGIWEWRGSSAAPAPLLQLAAAQQSGRRACQGVSRLQVDKTARRVFALFSSRDSACPFTTGWVAGTSERKCKRNK